LRCRNDEQYYGAENDAFRDKNCSQRSGIVRPESKQRSGQAKPWAQRASHKMFGDSGISKE